MVCRCLKRDPSTWCFVDRALAEVNFTVLSAEEISTYSEVEVLNQNNYDPRPKELRGFLSRGEE